MTYFKLEQNDNFHILWLDNAEEDNTFTTDVLEELNRHLDEVETFQGNTCLLVTADHHKTFSTGINLEWMNQQGKNDIAHFVHLLDSTLLRMALLNAPTLASINGNAYAGGAMLATACDFRIMRSDRGRYCLPEVKLEKSFTAAMIEIISLIPDAHSLNRLALTADAIGGEECLPMKVVDAIYPEEELFPEACRRASELAEKDRSTYTRIKRDLRQSLVEFRDRHIDSTEG